MFKRRTNLPARPLIPNKDEIIEDLKNSSSEDVIYELNYKVSKSKNEETEKEMESNSSYSKIDSFLNKMNELKDHSITLAEQKANLQRLEESLLKDMSHVKKELKSTSQREYE